MQADQIAGQAALKVFAHGDFHGSNLILGAGVTIGFDFTEFAEKLAIYDIVDYIKADVLRRTDVSDVDGSGISAQSLEMFFRLYRHPLDRELLAFAIRGRLLLDWLAITRDRHDRSAFQQRKFGLHQKRLAIAFAES